MKEDNIIPFRKPEAQNRNRSEDSDKSEMNLFLKKMKKGLDFEDPNNIEEDLALNPIVLVEMLQYLADLRKGKPFNVPSSNSIEIRRQGIEDSSDGWLFARINRSTKVEWKRQPTFYDAVLSELRRRNKINF